MLLLHALILFSAELDLNLSSSSQFSKNKQRSKVIQTHRQNAAE